MKKVPFKLLFLNLVIISCVNSQHFRQEGRIQYVDTRVGTAASVTKHAGRFGKGREEYAQTIPAVLEPNGMNFWTPQTRDTEIKCIAPYYYRDSILQGFRNSHWINGGCTQDYGSMTLMPLFGALKTDPEKRGSIFSHDQETATPSYYSVFLKNYGIKAEMTGKSRSAIFRFTYSEQGDAYLVVNPNSDEGEGCIEIDTVRQEIRGYNPVHRIYQGWGKYAGYNGYFIVSYQKPLEEFGTFIGDTVFPGKTALSNRKKIGAYLRFRVRENEEVIIKASSSFTDMEGARLNMEEEIPTWNFDQVRDDLSRIWEKQLALIEVETDSEEDKCKFYGALYRASFLPRTFNDVDGRYPSFAAGKPIRIVEKGRNYYDDFSMWDTYRALHPLLNIISPRKSGDMVHSLILKYEQGGWLPIFPCWNSYTSAMIGDHGISVIGDAFVKGVRNFDIEKAYEGMRKNAFESHSSIEDYKNGMGRRALKSYLRYGYIPLEDSVPDAFHTHEQVSRTLEYAYDDFVLAQVANALGKKEDYRMLSLRATNYTHVIDTISGYAQGRYADGEFLKANNAFNFVDFITEGTPAHYTWYVPHDVPGLIQQMGGRAKYLAKLDSMFSEGLYWHGNEPCHQIPFMFNYAGRAWRTQEEVRHIMETEYLNDPGGLSGNDDAGQMSAWYVFASLGFYPVCPGTPYYMIASPSFKKAVIKLENNKKFILVAHNASPENRYIRSVKLNGKAYTNNYLSHSDILKGGMIEFDMGSTPNMKWGQ
ncbi:GH92 family glycosyl hydrolase [Anaerorudis cellulosivorans]|uniref:GH92 family glycosyl hydrolase n=1 Tax=Anaerorudis cellulosivorans TaxID=3397862 RepID=UPI002220856C|nr:GH92 family glycosyl hydrolase [Seramator thermalis]MCW1734114.1 GH92 family glycosyl hydrolase [Seramator thermalis]